VECFCPAESIYIGKNIPSKKNKTAGKERPGQIIP
jgi:hypothetical protein